MLRTSRRLGALIGAALTIAAGWTGAAQAQTGDPIRIGAILASSGPNAAMGEPERKTLEVFIDAVNADGGLIGRPVQLVAYDSQGDPETARALAMRLVEEDNVIAMIGGSTTGETLAMMPVFDDHEIPFISLAGALSIVEPVKPFVFKTPHTDKMACEKIFADIAARGLAPVALMSATDDFGKSMRAACIEVAGDAGIAIAADETYDVTATEMAAPVGTIAQSQPQALVVAGAGEAPAVVVAEAVRNGLAVPTYLSHGVATAAFIEKAGAAADGVRLPSSAIPITDLLPETDPQRDVLVDFKTRYEEATGEPVSAFGGYAFDGLMLLVGAVKRAGSLDPFDVRNALESTSGFIGTAGVVNMTSMDHMGLDLSAFRMLEIQEGRLALVDE